MTILPASPPPSVILLGGASGSGKSYLARRHGRPHLSLDAFYRPQSDDGAAGGPGPVFPRTPYGEIDWDQSVADVCRIYGHDKHGWLLPHQPGR